MTICFAKKICFSECHGNMCTYGLKQPHYIRRTKEMGEAYFYLATPNWVSQKSYFTTKKKSHFRRACFELGYDGFIKR